LRKNGFGGKWFWRKLFRRKTNVFGVKNVLVEKIFWRKNGFGVKNILAKNGFGVKIFWRKTILA